MPDSPAQAFKYGLNSDVVEPPAEPKEEIGPEMAWPDDYIGPELAQKLGIRDAIPVSIAPNQTLYRLYGERA